MPTIPVDQLVTSVEVEIEQAEKRKERAKAEIANILSRARQEGRPSVTTEEQREIDEAFARHTRAQEEIEGPTGLNYKLKQAKQLARLELDNEVALRERHGVPDTGQREQDAPRRAYDQVTRIGAEPRTYRLDNDRKGKMFLRDVVAQYARRGDLEAEQRLNRHMQEERVDRGERFLQERANVGTSNFAGLVVPQYLTELYAPATAALRPFADICNRHDLPDTGMTVNISRITTPTTVALQTEGNAATSTDIDDTLLTLNVQTAEGYADLTRQAIERGNGVEDVTMDDLYRRYATTLDGTLVTQATTGLSAVAQSNTYDDTSITVGEMWPKFLAAAANAEAALLGMAFPDYAVMHSRRWYWLQAQLTTSWPFINSRGLPPQAGGVSENNGYNQGVRGVLPSGLPVIVDNNIATNGGTGTNQDEIYVVASSECHLWEDPNAPVFIRAEQPLAHQLAVRLVLYGYFAYTFARYSNGQQKIAGTGLVAPTW